MSCLTVTTSALFRSLLLGCTGGGVWLIIDGWSGSVDVPLEMLDVVVIDGNNCSMPVVEDELLLLIRRWFTVVVDVDEERLLKPAPLMYPPPNGTDDGVATRPLPVVGEADDLLTLRSVGPTVSTKII